MAGVDQRFGGSMKNIKHPCDYSVQFRGRRRILRWGYLRRGAGSKALLCADKSMRRIIMETMVMHLSYSST